MAYRNSPARARGRRLGVVITLGLVVAACGNWPTLGYGPERSGSNPLETAIGIGNVGSLQEAWSADAGGTVAPIVANGFTYVQSAGEIRAYSANGGTGCSGTPRVCLPRWTAANAGSRSPSVANNVLYASAGDQLRAFDARGTTNCSGAPKICAPLWSASPGSTSALSSPVVANGMVYVAGDALYAYDAAGIVGCAGAPKICAPLWIAPDGHGDSVSVADGVVYTVTLGQLAAFDATGSDCTGSPKTCTPLWTHARDLTCSGGCGLSGPPSIVDGRVYVADSSCCSGGMSNTTVLAFDAGGALGCGGIPKTCDPIAAAGTSSGGHSLYKGPPASVNDVVYAGDGAILARDAAGLAPLWRSSNGTLSSATLANGVVYALGAILTQPSTIRVYPVAYDAAGIAGCSGSPKTCAPLWSGPVGPAQDLFAAISPPWVGPTVANGTVYVRTDRLRAYTLP